MNGSSLDGEQVRVIHICTARMNGGIKVCALTFRQDPSLGVSSVATVPKMEGCESKTIERR